MKTKDFILIIPPASSSACLSLPLGALFLAESLLKRGFDVEIIEDTVENILLKTDKAAGEKLISFGISSLSGTQLQNAVKIAKRLKFLYPKIPIIFGGIHTTALPKETLRQEFIDYIVYAEGEKSLPLLLNAIRNKADVSQIKGIGYKVKGKCILTENMGYTPLDKIFHLPYHLLNMENYARSLIIGPKRNFYIMTSRGCPFRCKFCSNSSKTWPNTKMRYHTIEHIINDISTLSKNYNCDGITFGDENFFIFEERVVKVCREIIENKLNEKLRFRSAGRVDVLCKFKKETWKLLKEAGFIAMGVGIESGSKRILNLIGKNFSLEQIYHIDELLSSYKFHKTYNFMTCVPGETIDDLSETLKLVVDLAKTSKYSVYPFGTLHKYIPLPGTELFDIAVSNYGFKPPDEMEEWGKFDFENFLENSKVVRPWLSNEFVNYVIKVNSLIEGLNSLFTGKNADEGEIDSKIREIKGFIRYNKKL